MKAEPRGYRGLSDLQALETILIAGRQADNGSYYVHLGDIRWWLFYRLPGKELWPYLYLWEDEQDRVIGWTLLSPDEGAFDVFVRPELVGSPEMKAVYAWSADQIEQLLRTAGKDTIYKLWNASGDAVTASILHQLGFAPAGEAVYLVQDLRRPLPPPELPPGYIVRPCQGAVEVERRARAQYGAFGSRLDFSIYIDRFRRFMNSPVYNPQHDLVVETPGGQIASFCIFWLDAVNQVALFEPVGTHPDFQKLGLGKALLRAALRSQQLLGIQTAVVCTPAENQPAVHFYETSDFSVQDRLVTYTRHLDES